MVSSLVLVAGIGLPALPGRSKSHPARMLGATIGEMRLTGSSESTRTLGQAFEVRILA